MRLSNAHTHSSLCDGRNTIAEMAAKAYELGFCALGFSGHSFCPQDGFGMNEAQLAAYKEQVKAEQQRYKGKMSIYLGLELDSLSPLPKAGEFDYLIGSVHNLLAKDGRPLPVDWSWEKSREIIDNDFAGDGLAYALAYWQAVDAMLQSRQVDICGHFDLICKFNGEPPLFDEHNEAYRQAAADVLRRHAKNFVFEINTGGMAKGYLSRPYPDYWLWEILREEGARVMVNSDAHQADKLDFALAEMNERAQSFGLNVITVEEVCGNKL